MTLYDNVLEFRRHIGLPIGQEPQLLESEQLSFYIRFAMEELSELMLAHEHRDLVGSADALGDLVYVMVGAMIHMGLPVNEVLEIIHRANMSKMQGVTKRNGLGPDAAKPAGFTGPEAELKILLEKLLEN